MSKQRVIYIAGPMAGLPLHNFMAFLEGIPKAAQDYLGDTGHFPRIVCPAMVDLDKGFNPFLSLEEQGMDYQEILSEDLRIIRECVDRVYFLPGWDESKGARREMATAMHSGCEVRFIHD